ncbi:urease accessory protein UreF [Aureimonas sp. Leaf324]|uniref:urease accessory protein UreF n=1 Tax=Aureimonas sp. Leaf324 TaxID=1736336 RepID=UPI0006FE72D5|nr:urease accessory protein UreF [Aureimonas sp. Leaf324]KQQ88748.1 urease accessory protein UreF [Aureimonas sp. Leaf324]
MTDEAASGESSGLDTLLKLQTWLSPAFPIGAFGYSHGLEAAIADGLLQTGVECEGWIATLLQHGSGWNDLVLLAAAYRADASELAEITELGLAMSGSAERRREAMDLGIAFAEASVPWGGGPSHAATYPVAVGVLACREGLPLAAVCAAFAHAFAANLLSVCVRLVPLGQREAVAILRRLEPVLEAVARRAAASTLDDLGSAAILSEIQAMRHETLETRLFRS